MGLFLGTFYSFFLYFGHPECALGIQVAFFSFANATACSPGSPAQCDTKEKCPLSSRGVASTTQ